MKELPVYLFTGFLESGKTTFIQETLGDPSFNNGQRTLLLLCEEGEVEIDDTPAYMKNIAVEVLESEEELNPEVFNLLAEKHRPERILIEYNGMWQMKSLFETLPENWVIYQDFMFVDSATFMGYNANMRSIVVDKVLAADLVVFNRFADGMDKMEFHKMVRGISRGVDIVYESPDGKIQYDDIVDPLPFDIDAPVIKINDEDYAIWYSDLTEDLKKYDGKVVEYRAFAAVSSRMKPGMFFFGREIMTCCAEDMQFAGLLVLCDPDKMPENGKWYTMRLKMAYKWHKVYGSKGPVMTLLSVTPSEEPEQPVATFY